ncbi:FecR family protein [Pedobacter sp. ISL-68]|uniref:FecR family protein n=1 Tax=unclassified Pedobacter TaxID=2628915 RepID=UPI001BEAFE4F|nr:MULTISPECIES: FecR family protein [unclassified Pedobacter]MBT2563115.1 FecR family protein [Pedobacter sp. ISL-64]MBT2593453.1 FecR family protein [Pedobacter sp. ISL-68]
MSDIDAIKNLFERYLDGRCTPAEVKQLMQYFHADEIGQLTQLVRTELERPEENNDIDYRQNIDRVYERIQKRLIPEKTTWKLWRNIAAASILISLGIGAFITTRHPKVDLYTADIKPYTQKTLLKTAGGKSFVLSNVGNDTTLQHGNISIRKVAGQQLAYSVSEKTTVPLYDTIVVPAGGRPQMLILSDGSKILLNVATTLRFPENFRNEKGNEMELISGEIYCDIVHNPNSTLRIITPTQVTEEIGTAFNISAYADESITQTTLVKGTIKVNSGSTSKQLLPGEKAVTSNNQMSILSADLEETLAWKNGYFRFNGENLPAIMRQLSRWYNIEVAYKGTMTDTKFYGKVSRSKNISEVLTMLERTKRLHFSIQGRRVSIMP